MNAQELQQLLIAETVRQCGHELRQGQLSMSWLHLPQDIIIDQFRRGHYQLDEVKLKLYQGTWAEKGLLARLEGLSHCSNLKYEGPRVLKAFDGRLTGHVDAVINDIEFVEYKTVPTNEILAQVKVHERPPFKVFSQVQSYLKWGEFKKGYVIYESREGGAPWVTEIYPNPTRFRALDKIVIDVLHRIDTESDSRAPAGPIQNLAQHQDHGRP